MRLMSDSVLHFSDNRFPALQKVVWAETGLREIQPAEMEEERVLEALAVSVPARHLLDPLEPPNPRVPRLLSRVHRPERHCVQNPEV